MRLDSDVSATISSDVHSLQSSKTIGTQRSGCLELELQPGF